jgi:hypothetical protein
MGCPLPDHANPAKGDALETAIILLGEGAPAEGEALTLMPLSKKRLSKPIAIAR